METLQSPKWDLMKIMTGWSVWPNSLQYSMKTYVICTGLSDMRKPFAEVWSEFVWFYGMKNSIVIRAVIFVTHLVITVHETDH